MADNKDNKLTLKFIEDYKKFECLWNTNLKAYTNKNVRNEALRTLDRKYGLGGIKPVKNKIKSLRSYFAKEHGKYLRKEREVGEYEAYVPTWFAYKPLLFLKDTYALESQELTKRNTVQIADAEQERQYEVVNDDASAREALTPTRSVSSEVLPTPPKRKLMEREPPPYYSDEYSAFGEYIVHKIRNLRTRRLRNIAQHRISNILFELEMTVDSRYASIYSSSSSSDGSNPATPRSRSDDST